jgi:phospholipase C
MAVSPWTAGGWVSRQKFTAWWVLQFLERLTGVQEPSISLRCRKTFGDLTSVVCHDGISRPPVLPETGVRLDLATYEAA